MIGDHGVQGLPETLPIFPLPNALLLPRGRLPLNIFEPRYLNMTADALGAGRMIAMVRPRHGAPGLVADGVEVYAIGCAGRITSFSETDDGRFAITLRGVCRFRIADELDGVRGYRRVRADYTEFAADLEEDHSAIADRARLREAVGAFFRVNGIDVDWKALDGAADEPLVASVAMIAPLDPGEQQALLESPDLARRGVLLTALLEMAARGVGGTPQAARH